MGWNKSITFIAREQAVLEVLECAIDKTKRLRVKRCKIIKINLVYRLLLAPGQRECENLSGEIKAAL